MCVAFVVLFLNRMVMSVSLGCFEGSRGLSEIIFCTCFGRLIHTNEGDGGMGNLILLYFCLNNNKIRNAHLSGKIYLYHILNRAKK